MNLSDDRDLVGPWVFARISKPWHPVGRTVVGVVHDDAVRAGVVFEDYTNTCVTMHVAVDNPHGALRKLVPASFHYAFIQLGVIKAIGMVNSSNTASLRFSLKLGFRAEAIIPDVFPDGDLVILGMHRSACRWIPAEFRKAA